MSKVFPGRYTAEIDKPFIVFLIGMRVNRLLAVRKWLRTARAMNSMLRALQPVCGGAILKISRDVADPGERSHGL